MFSSYAVSQSKLPEATTSSVSSWTEISSVRSWGCCNWRRTRRNAAKASTSVCSCGVISASNCVSLGDMTAPPVFLPVSCKRLQFSPRASSAFEKPNAGRQAPLEAGLGRDKARCLWVRFLIPPVENRTCGFHRIRLNTFGHSPWGYHEASVSISAASTGLHPCFMPFRRHPREQLAWTAYAFAGYCVRRLPLYSVLPKARGLRPGEYAPCGRRYRPPTTTPPPPLLSGIGMSSRVSPLLLSPSLRILRAASRVRCDRLKRNEGGGVLLAAPSALCGSPVGIQGRAG